MTATGLTNEQLAITPNPAYTQASMATVNKNLIWTTFNTSLAALTDATKKSVLGSTGV